MTIRHTAYLAAALALAAGATSCEHEAIFEELEFSVRLSPTNTYVAGSPVVFDFSGNADFITVWNGDTGHDYKHRDRTSVSLEDIESCTLEIELQQRYGDSKAEVSNLDIIAGNRFAGLSGADAAADRTTVEAIAANDYADWTVLAYTPNRNDKMETYTFDITPLADNFSFGMHFHHEADKNMRTYYVNPKITVKFKGYDSQIYNFSAMNFQTFSLAEQHAANPYLHNEQFGGTYNGVLRLAGQPGSNASGDIVFQGFNAGSVQPIDQWIFMQPLALNTISPDKGMNIKGVVDDVRHYEHTYAAPGTYTAVFIVSSGNYQGESERVIHEVTFTVVDRIE